MLTAGAGTLTGGMLAGCSWLRDDSPPPTPDPLDALLRATHELAQRYESTVTAFPDLADRLGPLHATHIAHLAALRDVVGRDPASPSPTTAGTWTPPAGGDTQTAVAVLREAEEAARDQAATACLAAPPTRAVLLGTITAARASHVSVLS